MICILPLYCVLYKGGICIKITGICLDWILCLRLHRNHCLHTKVMVCYKRYKVWPFLPDGEWHKRNIFGILFELSQDGLKNYCYYKVTVPNFSVNHISGLA